MKRKEARLKIETEAIKTVAPKTYLFFRFFVNAASAAKPVPSKRRAAGSGMAILFKLRLSNAKVAMVGLIVSTDGLLQ